MSHKTLSKFHQICLSVAIGNFLSFVLLSHFEMNWIYIYFGIFLVIRRYNWNSNVVHFHWDHVIKGIICGQLKGEGLKWRNEVYVIFLCKFSIYSASYLVSKSRYCCLRKETFCQKHRVFSWMVRLPKCHVPSANYYETSLALFGIEPWNLILVEQWIDIL